jgi:ATP-dependent RNA helicase DbpA
MTTFNEFSKTELSKQPFSGLTALPPSLQQATAALGYDNMTAIQAAALPSMLERRDVLAQAKTGSGKTAAFGLGLLSLLNPEAICLQSLVLCPTRELAEQVSKEIRGLARFIPNIKVLSLCGGIPVHIHQNSLTHQPHVAVGTPGRIIDLIEIGSLKLDGIQTVVLDEADRMLDMGFLEQVISILKHTPSERLTWLFSATYPNEIRELSQHFQQQPVEITVDSQHEESVISQIFYRVDANEKAEAVVNLLLQQQASNCLIFCNTKVDVKDLHDFLWKRSIPVLALHGDLEQRDRDETLLQFANGSCRVLIATDVAARGLDIKALPMVLAFELPDDAESHTHRIGRTGRAGERGLAISLVASSERARLERIEAIAGERYSLTALPTRSQQRSLPAPQFSTLMIDGGRQDKLRPGDIVGALTGDGGLTAAQIGKIDVFATRAYVAVASGVLTAVVARLQKCKIKGKSFRVRKL